jgi:hypothetical protein
VPPCVGNLARVNLRNQAKEVRELVRGDHHLERGAMIARSHEPFGQLPVAGLTVPLLLEQQPRLRVPGGGRASRRGPGTRTGEQQDDGCGQSGDRSPAIEPSLLTLTIIDRVSPDHLPVSTLPSLPAG